MGTPPEVTDGQIHQRLQQFITHLGVSNNAFAKAIGDSSAKISQVTSPGGRTPDFRISLLVKVLAAFPQLSSDWLLTGEGPMLKTADPFLPEAKAGSPRPPVPGWRETLASAQKAQQTIPLVEQKAYASYLAGFADEPFFETRPQLYYPELKGLGPLMAIRVQGESMSPTILPDDVLLCSYHETADRIKNGGVYVVCTADGVAVKRLLQKNTLLRCYSDNPAYPPFSVELAEVRHLWRVRRRVTAFLEATQRMDDRLQTLEEEIEALKGQLR